MLRSYFFLILFGLAFGPASGTLAQSRSAGNTVEDLWSEPNPGLRYLVRTTDMPCRIHVLFVDMEHPSVRIVTTPYEERWSTVRGFAEKHQLAVAINGGFWGKMMRAWGVSAGFRTRWPVGEDDEDIGFFGVTKDGAALISSPSEVVPRSNEPALSEAVSGRPQLVVDGRIDEESLKAFEYSRFRHPRTAVGIANDGKQVILIVASGRQNHSRGLNLYELASLFVEFGAHSALNLDGGGSSTMYVAQEGGIVNAPSGGRWIARLGLGAEESTRKVSKVRTDESGVEEAFVRGVEREVMNHVGVMAAPKGSANTVEASADADSPSEPSPPEEHHEPRVHVQAPREPLMSFGKYRESLFPMVYGLVLIVPVALVAFFLWSRRRKR